MTAIETIGGGGGGGGGAIIHSYLEFIVHKKGGSRGRLKYT